MYIYAYKRLLVCEIEPRKSLSQRDGFFFSILSILSRMVSSVMSSRLNVSAKKSKKKVDQVKEFL